MGSAAIEIVDVAFPPVWEVEGEVQAPMMHIADLPAIASIAPGEQPPEDRR